MSLYELHTGYTTEQAEAGQQAIYDFLMKSPTPPTDGKEEGRNRYFGNVAGGLVYQYGLTFGDGGPRDAGPAMLHNLKANGGTIYDLGAGGTDDKLGHGSWKTALVTFIRGSKPDLTDWKAEAQKANALLNDLRAKVKGGATITQVAAMLGVDVPPAAPAPPAPEDGGPTTGDGGPGGLKS